MSETCSFCSLVNRTCGSSRGTDEFVSVEQCSDDISVHLASCHLSRQDISERDLILARAGLFGLNEKQIAKLRICPKHRQSLGKFWRPPRSCQHPEHTGKLTAVSG